MSRYDLIPAAMLVMGSISAIAALIGCHKGAGRALIAMLALFAAGLWFQAPAAPEHASLHPFPPVLFVLLVTFPVIVAATIFGGLARWVLRRFQVWRANRHRARL